MNKNLDIINFAVSLFIKAARGQEETEEPSIHPLRKAFHPLANGNIPDTKAQGN